MVELIARLALLLACILGIGWGAVLCQENSHWGAVALVPAVVVTSAVFLKDHRWYRL